MRQIEEKYIDVKKMYREEYEKAAKIGTPNGKRIFELIQAFNFVNFSVISKEGLNIYYGINYPSKHAGVVRIEGKKINIINPKVFYSAVSRADNYEVLPKTNGNVCLELTFHHLMLD